MAVALSFHFPSTLSCHDGCDCAARACVWGMNIHAFGCSGVAGTKVGKRRLSLSLSRPHLLPSTIVDTHPLCSLDSQRRPHLPSFRVPQSYPKKVQGNHFPEHNTAARALYTFKGPCSAHISAFRTLEEESCARARVTGHTRTSSRRRSQERNMY